MIHPLTYSSPRACNATHPPIPAVAAALLRWCPRIAGVPCIQRSMQTVATVRPSALVDSMMLSLVLVGPGRRPPRAMRSIRSRSMRATDADDEEDGVGGRIERMMVDVRPTDRQTGRQSDRKTVECSVSGCVASRRARAAAADAGDGIFITDPDPIRRAWVVRPRGS
jgi:hypothetical protein